MIRGIPILFQSEEILVVDKPIGISIHNAEDPTNLMTELAHQLGPGLRLFPVHRLDKETSGVQIFALNEKAATNFATAFQTRAVKKIYHGVLRGSLKHDQGSWTNAISDKSEGRINPAGKSGDRLPSETEYRVMKKTKFFTWCEFNLITGRQHQIRKHAAIAGHALVGDPRYGDKKYNARMAEMYGEPRMFLHCRELTLLGQRFESPRPEAFDVLDRTSNP